MPGHSARCAFCCTTAGKTHRTRACIGYIMWSAARAHAKLATRYRSQTHILCVFARYAHANLCTYTGRDCEYAVTRACVLEPRQHYHPPNASRANATTIPHALRWLYRRHKWDTNLRNLTHIPTHTHTHTTAACANCLDSTFAEHTYTYHSIGACGLVIYEYVHATRHYVLQSSVLFIQILECFSCKHDQLTAQRQQTSSRHISAERCRRLLQVFVCCACLLRRCSASFRCRVAVGWFCLCTLECECE